ncbi:hypothetical protein C2G38_2153221 [Gigaspora rosea]|uniref:Uncharacterized protein n=1 Tax=Gigaspora rosea TaxID=44941 RepID=A0A397W7F1_9GLOM|nr:hypothetical protein C2G38_2153221 [Gigaspora rosea]
MTNQVSYQEQPCQPQPTTHDSSNNQSLYKFSSFADQTCSYTTSLANHKLSEQVTSVTNYAQRTDGPYPQKIHPTLPNSINDPRSPNNRNNLPSFSSYPKSLSLQVDKPTFQNFQSKDHIDLKQQKLKKPKNRIDPYSVIADIKNQAANIICRQLLTIKNNGSNKVSKGEEVDNYYFGKYNNNRESLMGKSGVKKKTNKEVSCKIDVEMSEPSGKGKIIKTMGVKEKDIGGNENIDKDENDDSWDSDNETVVGNYKKSIEVENVCNKVWEKRVAALSSPQQNKKNSKDSSFQLAISILKGEEETETIRELQIRTSGRLRL